MTPLVVGGLDLSLSGTGLARLYPQAGKLVTRTVKVKLTGLERMREILSYLPGWLGVVDLAVVEGPSYGSTGKGTHERAGLWWMVFDYLDRQRFPVAVVPPASVKQYATGKGNASKDDMLLAAAKRLPDFDGDNNAADAAWLAALGAEHLGMPLVPMPAVNRRALDKVPWPEMGAAA